MIFLNKNKYNNDNNIIHPKPQNTSIKPQIKNLRKNPILIGHLLQISNNIYYLYYSVLKNVFLHILFVKSLYYYL